MTLDDILVKCKDLNIHEARESKFPSEYKEIVIFSKDLVSWSKVLAEVFGEPAKPAGVEPTRAHFDLTKPYGGIYENQTLFQKELNDKTALAMLWPWQDRTHITLKIIFLKKA